MSVGAMIAAGPSGTLGMMPLDVFVAGRQKRVGQKFSHRGKGGNAFPSAIRAIQTIVRASGVQTTVTAKSYGRGS